MEVVISQMRWPVELHRKLKELAHEERKSINKIVIEAMQEFVKTKAIEHESVE